MTNTVSSRINVVDVCTTVWIRFMAVFGMLAIFSLLTHTVLVRKLDFSQTPFLSMSAVFSVIAMLACIVWMVMDVRRLFREPS